MNFAKRIFRTYSKGQGKNMRLIETSEFKCWICSNAMDSELQNGDYDGGIPGDAVTIKDSSPEDVACKFIEEFKCAEDGDEFLVGVSWTNQHGVTFIDLVDIQVEVVYEYNGDECGLYEYDASKKKWNMIAE